MSEVPLYMTGSWLTRQGSAARAGLYLLSGRDCVKSLRSSYTGLYPQKKPPPSRSCSRPSLWPDVVPAGVPSSSSLLSLQVLEGP